MKVSCFLVGRQGVRCEASEDQQLRWREYGGMRNYCFELTRAVSDIYGIATSMPKLARICTLSLKGILFGSCLADRIVATTFHIRHSFMLHLC